MTGKTSSLLLTSVFNSTNVLAYYVHIATIKLVKLNTF